MFDKFITAAAKIKKLKELCAKVKKVYARYCRIPVHFKNRAGTIETILDRVLSFVSIRLLKSYKYIWQI